jgi:ring-1,2-phenylacetyl-CoA epoxidase subunit PaaE
MSPRFHKLKIKDIRKETEDCVSIAFEVPSELTSDYQYLAGQYLTLKTMIDEEDVRRSYSLCSAPFENEWRVAIKQVEDGKFSTFANNNLNIGDSLEVMTPMGNFALKSDENAKKSYALFAAGSGVTPILSIAKEVLKSEPNSTITLFYGNKGFNDVIFREDLEELKNCNLTKLSIVHVFSRESLGNKLQKGRIDKAKTKDLYNAFLKHNAIDETFICGPEQMILDVKAALEELGVDSKKVHFELFTSGTKTNTKKPEAESNLPTFESNVQVILDDDTFEFNLDSNGLTILDAAQKAGGDLPYACKGGVCCTCKARVLEGSVRMVINYALTPEEVEAGYVLTCQAHPTSEKVVVSFDE